MKLTILPNPTLIQWRRLLCTLSVVYFLAACASPALYFQKVLDVTARNPLDGWIVLLCGWMGIVFWWTLAWLANPCYVIALICFLRWARGATIIWGSFALLFALLTLELFFRSSLGNLGGDEKLVGLGSGFYFWLASIVILLFAAWMDSDEGDAFFQQRFPWIQIAGKTLSSAFLLTFVLSLPALTIGGTNFFTTVIKINRENREYQEYLRNHPPDDRATREAKEREKSVSLVGGSDRAIDWNQDGQLDIVYINLNVAGVEPGNYLWTGLITAQETPQRLPEKTVFGGWGEGWLDRSATLTVTIAGNEMLDVWHDGSYRLSLSLVRNSDDPEKRLAFDVQGDYITHSYNPRQFLPVDRSERPPP